MPSICIVASTMVIASIGIVTVGDRAIVTDGTVVRRPDGTRTARVGRSHRGSLVVVKNSDGSITYACGRESTPTVEEK